MGEKFLRTKQVEEQLGVSRITLWRWEKAGTFPKRFYIGPNTSGWFQKDIDKFLKSKR